MSSSMVRAVQFNFVNFLWKNLDRINDALDVGDYILALQRALRLITFLPSDIKEHFREKIEKIESDIRRIVGLANNGDVYLDVVGKHRSLQAYARRTVMGFVDELMTVLDDRGYLEARRSWEEGYSHTWLEKYAKKLAEKTRT